MKNKKEILEKITQKKEFSKLRNIDVEMAFEKFDKKEFSFLDKIKLTRDLLRKVFSAFTSRKLLSLKEKDPEWFLKKHLSTRERMNVQRSSKLGQTGERFDFYDELYERILKNYKTASVIDLGSGVNGFSYGYFGKRKIEYLAVDSVGQLIDLMNFYFDKKKLNARAVHFSLFELNEIKKEIKKTKKPRVVFLFKVLDSLEMIQKDYSKKLLLELFPLVDQIVLSFATRSLTKRTKFKVQRKWIFDFVKENFEILDDFELGNEKYLVLKKKI